MGPVQSASSSSTAEAAIANAWVMMTSPRHQGINHPLALGLILNMILLASTLAALIHGCGKYLKYLPDDISRSPPMPGGST